MISVPGLAVINHTWHPSSRVRIYLITTTGTPLEIYLPSTFTMLTSIIPELAFAIRAVKKGLKRCSVSRMAARSLRICPFSSPYLVLVRPLMKRNHGIGVRSSSDGLTGWLFIRCKQGRSGWRKSTGNSAIFSTCITPGNVWNATRKNRPLSYGR